MTSVILVNISSDNGSTPVWRLPSILYYKTHLIPKHNRFSSRLVVVFAKSIEATCKVENEDAPTTSEWSTILLPTKVRLILETLR